jgi:hypothetical protein
VALRGLGLSFVATELADAVALEAFPWTPLGLTVRLARPDLLRPATATPPAATVTETLESTTQ